MSFFLLSSLAVYCIVGLGVYMIVYLNTRGVRRSKLGHIALAFICVFTWPYVVYVLRQEE